MKSFIYLLGVSVLFAVFFIGAGLINKYLSEQKNTICYVGMVIVDVLSTVAYCLYILTLCDII